MGYFFRKIKTFFLKPQRTTDLGGDFVFLDPALRGIDSKIKRRRRASWVEESFLNYSAEELARGDKNYLGLSLARPRLRVFLFLIIFILAGLLARASYLQVAQGGYYSGVAERNRIRLYNLPAPRGIIYDRQGRVLVENVPGFAVYVVPSDLNATVQGREQTLAWLRAQIGGEELEANLKKISGLSSASKEYFAPVRVQDGLDYEKALTLRVESANYPAVEVETVAQRKYISSFQNYPVTSLSLILGYEGKIDPAEFQQLEAAGYLFNDSLGKTGLEKTYETALRGQYGREQMEVNSLGRPVKIISKEDRRKGDNLYLSLDLDAQAKLEQIVRERLAKLNKRRAAAIALDPRTGEILAMVNWPSFDNNLFARGISTGEYDKLAQDNNQPLFSRAISGEYPSGSTIKPVIAAAALQEGIIKEHTSFLSVGGLRIDQWFFPDWKIGGHGLTDVKKALADSVNTFFYIVGGGYQDKEGLGVYKLKEYGEKFGLNKLTGIDLPNEKSGFWPTPEWKLETKKEPWYIGDTYHLSIGQGDLTVTPLQVANYTAAIANGGKLLKPHLVVQYYDQAKQTKVVVAPQILNQDMVSPENLRIVQAGMRQTVTQGSARILQDLPVASAAKTGTAQGQEGKATHSWFTAFAPYGTPEIVLTVLVEEGGDGTVAAAPIAEEFLQWYFRVYKPNLVKL